MSYFGPVIRFSPFPFWPCNKRLKTNNGCSLLSFILAKLLLLDISCENIYASSIATALTACPLSIKKDAKMSDFLCENRKNSLAAKGYARRLFSFRRLGVSRIMTPSHYSYIFSQ